MFNYKGNVYKTFRELGAATGLDPDRISRGIQRGLPVEDAVEWCRKCDAKRLDDRTDHKGVVYDSVKAMCEAYGLPYTLYMARKTMGLSKEEALSRPIRGTSTVAPNGQTYPTVMAMCRAYGINISTYTNRIRKGMSLEEALTKPIEPGRGVK